MSNTIKNSQSYIDLIINNSEYWDLTLSNETDPKKIYDGSTFYYDKMISLIDIDENFKTFNALFILELYFTCNEVILVEEALIWETWSH